MENMQLNVRPSSIRESIAATVIVCTIVGLTCMGIFGDESVKWLILTPLYCIVPILIGVAIVRAMRRRRVGTVLAHVEEAVRLNLPLTDMMRAASNSESLKTRERLMVLHDNLQVGQPLALALYNALPEMPPSDARAIAAAMRIGSLPRELRRMLKRYIPTDGLSPNLDRYYRSYTALVSILLLVFVTLLISVVVYPKYFSLFASFGIKLPWISLIMIQFYSSYPIMILLAVLVLLFIIPWRGAAKDYLIWWVPVAGGAAHDEAMARLCAFLSDAIEAGQPMDEALLQAESAQPNAVVRNRVRIWRYRLTGGESIETAARHAAMPPLVVSMIKSARNGEGTLQVLTFLARHYEFRFSRLRELIRAAAIPTLVACTGALVLCVQLSIFKPLIAIIDVLALGNGPHRGGF
jgi:type II secretory pathway component PulF